MQLRWFLIIFLLMSKYALSSEGEMGSKYKLDGDYGFINLNYIAAFQQKNPYGKKRGYDQYIEIEFGGKSGRLELYGYVDILDIAKDKRSDNHNGNNLFLEFKPKLAILEGDLDFIQNFYLSGLISSNGGGGLMHQGYGFGTNLLGFLGVNLYFMKKVEDFGSSAEGKFDGQKLELTWFKPIKILTPNYYLAYQGYLNIAFNANKVARDKGRTSHEQTMYNGFYIHGDHLALGYAFKLYNNAGYWKNNNQYGFKSRGVGHFLVFSYKM